MKENPITKKPLSRSEMQLHIMQTFKRVMPDSNSPLKIVIPEDAVKTTVKNGNIIKTAYQWHEEFAEENSLINGQN